MMSNPIEQPEDSNAVPADIDPIWMSGRTARQIYALGEVEKVLYPAFRKI